MKKTCVRCKEEKSYDFFQNCKQTKDGKHYYCKVCRKEMKRAEYQKNKERYKNFGILYRETERGKLVVKLTYKRMREMYPEKYKARTQLNAALRRGEIVRPNTCESCLCIKRVCGHHDDYGSPLRVRWLCYQCHTDWHKENGYF